MSRGCRSELTPSIIEWKYSMRDLVAANSIVKCRPAWIRSVMPLKRRIQFFPPLLHRVCEVGCPVRRSDHRNTA